MAHIAVLTFPGNNCEQETLRAIKNSGMTGEIFLWNQSPKKLESFDAIVIPGGFSFEDRGRSGIISAQEPIIKTVKKMAKSGTPILGICNGAQIVVESGLLLESKEGIPAVALSRNKRKDKNGEILGTGFYHSWRMLKNINHKTPFSQLKNSLYIPLAHGEGRFVFPQKLKQKILENNLIVYQYTDEFGNIDSHFPINPNGSFHNAAAVCNPAGNVMAIMPHPERAEEGSIIFKSLKLFFEKKLPINNKKNIPFSFEKRKEKKSKEGDIELYIRLKITDNTEKTFESVLHSKISRSIKLIRRIRWTVHFSNIISDQEKFIRARQLILSNELLNINKESVIIKINKEFFTFSGGKFEKISVDFSQKDSFEVRENEDFIGESKKNHLNTLFPNWGFSHISYGIFWTIKNINKNDILQMPLFANFVGETIFSV